MSLTKRQQMLFDIQQGTLTVAEAKLKYPEFFSNKKYPTAAYRARREYLDDAPLPDMRTNYYFNSTPDASQAILATLYACYIARTKYSNLLLEDAIFIAKHKGKAFRGYTGQPIIIWYDFNPRQLLSKLGGPSHFGAIFDPYHADVTVDDTYHAVRLINAYNIVTGSLNYRKFLDELAGEYRYPDGYVEPPTDKNYIYRRFPFVITATRHKIQCNISHGFKNKTNDWQKYDRLATLPINILTMVKDFEQSTTPESRLEFCHKLGEHNAKIFSELLSADDQLRQKPTNRKITLADIRASIEKNCKELFPSPEEIEYEESSMDNS